MGKIYYDKQMKVLFTSKDILYNFSMRASAHPDRFIFVIKESKEFDVELRGNTVYFKDSNFKIMGVSE